MIKQTFVSVCIKQNVKQVEALLKFLPLIPTKRMQEKQACESKGSFQKMNPTKLCCGTLQKRQQQHNKNTQILSLNKSNRKQILYKKE